MAEKQKPFFQSAENLTFIGLFVVILVCFLLFVPKVASTLFPWKRQMVLDHFLGQVSAAKSIPPQAFWEFREFYSPGYYTFNKNGLSQSQIAAAEQAIHVFIHTKTGDDDVFLSFTSPHLHSIEALVRESALDKIIAIPKSTISQSILSTPNEKIWKDVNGHIYIMFLKLLSQMKTANGYFDYSGTDKSLVSGKYWFDITEFDVK